LNFQPFATTQAIMILKKKSDIGQKIYQICNSGALVTHSNLTKIFIYFLTTLFPNIFAKFEF